MNLKNLESENSVPEKQTCKKPRKTPSCFCLCDHFYLRMKNVIHFTFIYKNLFRMSNNSITFARNIRDGRISKVKQKLVCNHAETGATYAEMIQNKGKIHIKFSQEYKYVAKSRFWWGNVWLNLSYKGTLWVFLRFILSAMRSHCKRSLLQCPKL